MKKTVCGIALALLLIVGVTRAAELSEAEVTHCQAEGGCVLASQAAIKELLAKAYAAGRERGSISCGNKT